MASRKETVKDIKDLANKLTLMEGGKSSIKVGDMRQALKLLVALETAGILTKKKSAVMKLRRAAVADAKAIREKNGKPFHR